MLTNFIKVLAAMAACSVQVSLADELSDTDKALIQAVRDAGGQAMQLAKNDTRLTIAFHLSDKEIVDDTLKILTGANNVYCM